MNWIVKCNPCLCCCCRKGFQNLEKIKDVNRQSRQLEELTGKMRECKRYSEIEPPLSFQMHVTSVHLTVQHWLNTLSNSILNEYSMWLGKKHLPQCKTFTLWMTNKVYFIFFVYYVTFTLCFLEKENNVLHRAVITSVVLYVFLDSVRIWW